MPKRISGNQREHGPSLTHITDDSPIAARQCIKVLPSIVKYKPDLKADVESALRSANTARYKDSMQPLIVKDIQTILTKIVKY